MKAIRWASDRIGDDGIVAFVTNNGFLEGVATDGMRKHLADDFEAIYILDLGGNVRKNPKLSGTTHNVFGIQVGVSINLFVRKRGEARKEARGAKIYYAVTQMDWRREQKYCFLDDKKQLANLEWEKLEPDTKNTWLRGGLIEIFDDFLQLGDKTTKGNEKCPAVFRLFSNGVKTNRDIWAYSFSAIDLEEKVRKTMDAFNVASMRWQKRGEKSANIDDFLKYEDSAVAWSDGLKTAVERGYLLEWNPRCVRQAIYRPFTKRLLYFDPVLNERRYQFPLILPTMEAENENRIICVVNEAQIPFSAQITNVLPCLHFGGRQTQCVPFYTYAENGSDRRENITDWALREFQTHYHDWRITKWDIFHYVYAVLHHPEYRERYAANLRRELPRIPYTPDFRDFAAAGKQLAELHVNYEQQEEYWWHRIENPKVPLSYRVEKMKLSKDKGSIIYNEFLTIDGIPPEAFEYRLGNRSALEWVIDQYQVSTDKRSGITNDPNRLDDPEYILRLIGQVITVSLKTIKIVKGLPALEVKQSSSGK